MTNNDPKFEFDKPEMVENIMSHYPDKRSAVLPLLHLAQSQEGFISSAVMRTIGQLVDVVPAEIADTVSFYTMLYTEPQGKFNLQVCQTLSCSLNGADELVDHICGEYKINPGETTEDGKFTLTKVECLGACGTAPVVQINNDYHEGLSIESLDKLLDSLE